MPAIVAASIAFALIFGSTLLGMFIRSRVPDAHLAGDSKDVMRLATALIATMSAVVRALLSASTRGSFEQTSATVTRLTTDIIELDQTLKEYGRDATPLRKALRDSIVPMIDSIWRDGVKKSQADQPYARHESVLYGIRELAPRGHVQVSLQARALQLSTDVSQTRLILFICVLSTSTAIFLILELGQPFDGLMQIPNAGLRNALPSLPSPG